MYKGGRPNRAARLLNGCGGGWRHQGERPDSSTALKSAAAAAVEGNRSREPIHLEEVDPKTCAPILKRYLHLAPGARAHVAVDPAAPLGEFERVAVKHPVFLIRSDSSRAE
jgi:hypothetical protein